MAPQISGTNARFLRPEFVFPTIFEIMDPYLAFLDILPTIASTTRSVGYVYEDTSADSDPKKKRPAPRAVSTRYPKLDISNPKVTADVLTQKGFAIELDRDSLTMVEGIDNMRRAFNRAGFWLAQAINSEIGETLIARATIPTWNPKSAWNASGATPVDDLVGFRDSMDRDGYAYSMTDVYCHKTNWKELNQYLMNVDITDGKQEKIFGTPTVTSDIISIPILGGDVHKLRTGFDEGSLLGLDRNNPAGTVYYYNDPEFSPLEVTYQTKINNVKTPKTVKNFGISYNQYVDQESRNTVIQFGYDLAVAVKEPYAVLYKTGI